MHSSSKQGRVIVNVIVDARARGRKIDKYLIEQFVEYF